MRIVYFSSSTLPSQAANSVHVAHMAEAFGALGHEVRLIHVRAAGDSTEDVFSFYGLKGLFTLCSVVRPRLRYVGLVMYSLLGFARYVIGSKAALVYSRDYVGALFSAMAWYRTVFELHSMPQTWLTKLAFRLVTRCPRLVAVVAISAALRDDVVRRYPQLQGRVIVAHDAANEHVDVVPRRLGAEVGIKVGYVGGLYQGKGVEVVVDVARRMPEVEFHVVGGQGELLDEWRRKTVGVPNVLFHGFKPYGEIPSYISAFDIVLLPNQRIVHTHSGSGDIGRWTSPLKMFEYMSAGKSIICSDLPVLREVMVDNHNCLLCCPDDPAQWVLALERLRADDKLRDRLGRQAKIDFLETYTWRGRAERLLSELL